MHGFRSAVVVNPFILQELITNLSLGSLSVLATADSDFRATNVVTAVFTTPIPNDEI